MGRHRLERHPAGRPGGRRKATPHRSRRRAAPRYGRGSAALLAAAITLFALLAGTGLVPLDGDQQPAAAGSSPSSTASPTPTARPTPAPSAAAAPAPASTGRAPAPPPARTPARPKADPTALPAGSGTGKRIVFSEAAQRVWLVARSGRVLSTYLVSGSLTDNLHPGTYEVFSRSRWAVGIEDSGTMEYFVRFTRGENAAIGFHTIPTKDGRELQTEAQLGTPQSHGCIRQRTADAIRLWEFAPEGTTVVVL